MSPLGTETGMIKAVLFDLYGTLIDIRTDEDDSLVYESLSRYLGYRGVRIDPDELRSAYHSGIKEQLRRSRETFPEVDIFDVFKDIIRGSGSGMPDDEIAAAGMLFRALTVKRFGLFPGVEQTLAGIAKQYKIGLVSDAQWVFTEPEITMTRLDRFFPVRVLSSRLRYKKPDRRLFDMVLRKLGIRASEAVYIGDNTTRDLQGARNAGMPFILFRGECRYYNGLTPDRCFNEYGELPEILRSGF